MFCYFHIHGVTLYTGVVDRSPVTEGEIEQGIGSPIVSMPAITDVYPLEDPQSLEKVCTFALIPIVCIFKSIKSLIISKDT